MDLLLTGLAIVLGCALVLGLLVLMVSWWLEEQYGAIVSKALLGYTVSRIGAVGVLVALLLVCAVVMVPPAYWHGLTTVMGGLGLIGLGGLAWLWRRNRARCGTVFMDLGHIGTQNNRVSMAIGCLGGSLLVLGLGKRDLVWLSQGLYLLGLALGQYLYDRTPLLITEEGIFAPEGSVRWPQVKELHWCDGTHRVAALMVKTNRVIFNRQVLRIPWEALDEVDVLISEYLPDLITPNSKPLNPRPKVD
jgi:hypothetical protein